MEGTSSEFIGSETWVKVGLLVGGEKSGDVTETETQRDGEKESGAALRSIEGKFGDQPQNEPQAAELWQSLVSNHSD